jgi:DNA-binding response OmpR family regulator
MKKTPFTPEHINILLVDDDNFLVSMYAMKFHQAGFNVRTCLSVRDAIKMIKEGFEPHAILFDIIMPEGDGFSLLETLRGEKLAEDALKVALTNEMSDEQKRKASALGSELYIVKATMIPSEVVNRVSEKLAEKYA